MFVSGRPLHPRFELSRRSLLGAGVLVLLLVPSPGKGQGPADGDVRTVQGTVCRMTTAPRGEVDGAVLEDGTVIHWPPHLEDRFRRIAARGERVKVTGRMETGPEGDTHLEVEKVTNLRIGDVEENDGAPPPRGRRRRPGRFPPPPPPDRRPVRRIDDGERKTVAGTVRRMTMAPRGEIDGAVLEDGTVIHWPPHLEDRFRRIAVRGDRVKVIGRMETGPEGDTHLEVDTLINLRTRASSDGATEPAADERPAPVAPADRKQRLRELQEQVERLQREIRRLEREP
jgi:hypothetical protein